MISKTSLAELADMLDQRGSYYYDLSELCVTILCYTMALQTCFYTRLYRPVYTELYRPVLIIKIHAVLV